MGCGKTLDGAQKVFFSWEKVGGNVSSPWSVVRCDSLRLPHSAKRIACCCHLVIRKTLFATDYRRWTMDFMSEIAWRKQPPQVQPHSPLPPPWQAARAGRRCRRPPRHRQCWFAASCRWRYIGVTLDPLPPRVR